MNRVKVKFGKDEDYEASLVKLYNDADDFDRERIPRVWMFDSSGAFVKDLKGKVEDIARASALKLGVESDLEFTLKYLRSSSTGELNPLIGASYDQRVSSPKLGIFNFPIDGLLSSLYCSKSDVSLLGEDRAGVESNMDHEMRHHLDLRFIKDSTNYKHADLDNILFDDWMFSVLKENRIEGFANFEPLEYSGDGLYDYLIDELRENTQSVRAVMPQIRTEFPKKGGRGFGLETGMLMANGPLDDGFRRAYWWKGFSAYVQGKHLMEVIAAERLGDMEMTREDYKATLKDVSEMDIGQFYRTYFDSLKKLHFGAAYSIFPPKTSMRIIKERVLKEKDE